MNKFSSKQTEAADTADGYVKLLISDYQKTDENLTNPVLMRLFSAVFYGLSSFLIIVVNKILLTTYK